MVTAPHGHELYRGGGDSGERERIHRREQWTTELALRLALRIDEILAARFRGMVANDNDADGKTPPASPAADKKPPTAARPPAATNRGGGSCSFVVWNSAVARPLDRSLKDPNYLQRRDFATSPWHQGLTAFRERWQGAGGSAAVVPLHVDLHGKLNRKDDFDLDVGVDSMKEIWAVRSPEAAAAFSVFNDTLQRNFQRAVAACPVTHKGMAATVEMEPWLSGLWGTHDGAPVTMTTQAILLGLHSFQLEVPLDMRRALQSSRDTAFFDAFATAIADVFLAIQPSEEAVAELRAYYATEAHASARLANRAEAQRLLDTTTAFFARPCAKSDFVATTPVRNLLRSSSDL